MIRRPIHTCVQKHCLGVYAQDTINVFATRYNAHIGVLGNYLTSVLDGAPPLKCLLSVHFRPIHAPDAFIHPFSKALCISALLLYAVQAFSEPLTDASFRKVQRGEK